MPTRRTKAEIAAVRAEIYRVAEEEHPVSIRRIFYALAMARRPLVAKLDSEYKGTIGRLSRLMRRAGELPFPWIADFTRFMRKPRTHNTLQDAIDDCAEHYRKALWYGRSERVEIWCEKDALLGVLYPVTSKYDVPLMIARGFSSDSFLWAAAEGMKDATAEGIRTVIYYFADYDASGQLAMRKSQEKLRTWSGVDFDFHVAAVTPEQIEALNLPTRPNKKSSHERDFKGKASVELDAIPAPTLRAMCERCILNHLGERELEVTLLAEREEREMLRQWAAAAAD